MLPSFWPAPPFADAPALPDEPELPASPEPPDDPPHAANRTNIAVDHERAKPICINETPCSSSP
jgi:hypothetical protein